MSIDNAVGKSFPVGDVSVGPALLDGNNYDFTGLVDFPLGSVTITSYNPVNNLVNFQFSDDLTQVIDGTLLGNTADSFVIAAVVSVFGLSPVSLYFTNTAQAVPGSATVTVEALAPVYVACYCKGTSIRTPDGPRLVEELRAGDLVDCLNGGVAPVRWVGHRSYGSRFLRANPKLRPVRFKAGALGDALPERDLLVSPQHAMLIDGALVPAELLVNGTTIMTETGMDEVQYFHVELPDHDAVWAENVLSETFVDDGSRGMFHNAESYAAMYPRAEPSSPVFFAPRLESGAALDAIRAQVRGRAPTTAIAA